MGGAIVAILRIMASTRRLSPSESVGAVFFDFGKKADLVFGEFAQHFLGFAVARRFRSGEKIGQGHVHGFGNLGKRLERRHGVAVFHAREVAAQQARAAFDIALRQSPLAAIRANHFSDIYFWFFFWHVVPTSWIAGILRSRLSARKRILEFMRPSRAEKLPPQSTVP